MASKPFNAAVVGYGLSAKVFHIPLILALPNDFKLYGVVQRSPKPNNDASKAHSGIKLFRSVDEVYKDSDVDLIVITSTPGTHFSMVKDALEAGKNVVVEKPFVPAAKEANELIEIQKKSGKVLAVYQNRRWDSDFLTLRQLMDAGSLGSIAEFETHFDRHRPEPPSTESWKNEDAPGHGSIFDLGTHLIDQIYHLFGMPKRVTGFLYQQRRGVDGGPHDSFTAILQYADGMMATARAGVVGPEVEQLRFWVRGTKASFKKFHLDVQEDQLKDGARPGDKGFGEEPESHFGTLTTMSNGAPTRNTVATVQPPTYVEYYRVLAKALRGEGESPVKPEGARDVLRIIEAAIESSKESRTIAL